MLSLLFNAFIGIKEEVGHFAIIVSYERQARPVGSVDKAPGYQVAQSDHRSGVEVAIPFKDSHTAVWTVKVRAKLVLADDGFNYLLF